LHRRFGGDPEARRVLAEQLQATRDRVLDRASLAAGETVLDVGCGDGLIAFGALDRAAGAVIFSDISTDLIDEAKRLATELAVLPRSRFVVAAADDLAAIDTESVDVVTTRSVLIYVDDKLGAFREFHRVLRPRGRLSLFEPINRLNRFARAYDAGDVRELDDRVKGVFETLQPRDSDPMLNFDDRDLLDFAETTGFTDVNLTLEVTVGPPEPAGWDVYANTAWNPRIPTIREVMDQVLSPDERRRYEEHMRPLVESGTGSRRMAAAYFSAVKAPA
jgi:ubiquinone/menaquinone biosynthesis C-methylase UbiE